jgi:group I intron endonuclease
MLVVYILTFPTGKSYVGISSNGLPRRLALHRWHARNGRAGMLYRAIRKYGENSFSAEVLLIADDWDFICEMERRAIVAFKARFPGGYNLTDGGESGYSYTHTPAERAWQKMWRKDHWNGGHRPAGWHHTEDAKRRIAEAGRGRVFDEHTRARIGATHVGNTYNVGRECSPATRAKISASQIGKPRFTTKQKQALSAFRKGKPWSPARRAAHEARRSGHGYIVA